MDPAAWSRAEIGDESRQGMVVVDMIWGMALYTGVSAITYLASARIVSPSGGGS